MHGISVVGLGKLGACVAAALALKGRTVVGVDVRPELVDAINERRAPVAEPGLQEALTSSGERLTATLLIESAVAASDLTFVVVPTPSEPSGAFSLVAVEDAFAALGRALRHKDGWHLVVLTSTVLPGMTRHALIPLLEEASGKVCGRDFGVCYSPAFIALGSVIRDFLNPDLVLVGESDARAGELLGSLYADVLENGAPVRRMTLENAELAKIGVNTFVTTKIAFANMLADLCERLPGGDVDVVTNALGLDRRIGRRYLTGGLGYGGPCFPRDNQALSYLARALGTGAPLAEATDRANRDLPARVVERLRELARGRTVAVLGLAYKPGTSVTEASQGVWLARELAAAGGHVRAFDPLAGEEVRRELGHLVTVASTLADALRGADLVLICTPDTAFRNLATALSNGKPLSVTVIDFWRTLEADLESHPGVVYVAVGRSLDDPSAHERLARLWGNGPPREPERPEESRLPETPATPQVKEARTPVQHPGPAVP